MIIHFRIHYHTRPGESLSICGSWKELGNGNPSKATSMTYLNDGIWNLSLEVKNEDSILEYKYIFIDANEDQKEEWGTRRKLKLKKCKELYLIDSWRTPGRKENVFYSSAFQQNILKRTEATKGNQSIATEKIEFSIDVPFLKKNEALCVLGNDVKLGNWKFENALLLDNKKGSVHWAGSIPVPKDKTNIQYKYGIYSLENNEFFSLENGYNRSINLPDSKDQKINIICSDENFRNPGSNWKGAGVSIPVFSLRSNQSHGVGDFNDLITFIDWSNSVGLKMVQILPINDTIANHNWLDSYPYKSISVMALHPIYMNLDKMGNLNDHHHGSNFLKKKLKLNCKEHVDYIGVLKDKFLFFKKLFEQEKKLFFDKKEYKEFYEANKEWLIPYAAFSFLRDKYHSVDFRQWEKYSKYDEKKILKLGQKGSKVQDDIRIHYFIQFHLDKQLKEASDYARSKGIVLKGDIPIGISPNSVEAWTEPSLFNLNAQAGAPPDDFAIKGQNWGFPTYNWDIMSKDGYQWWKLRLLKMSEYFDAYRIDHILGFFRIWEIPMHAVEGVLGYFNPAIALSKEEIEKWGIPFNEDRLTKPYIPHQYLIDVFGDHCDEVIANFLCESENGFYQFKKEFDTQVKINAYFLNNKLEEDLNEKEKGLRAGLFDLLSNIIFIQLGENAWHPRVMVQHTRSYAELDSYRKAKINNLYNDFYYKRHNDYWHQKGLDKLPAITSASNMLVCGEDLGMVPDCVAPVMDQLNILSLEIQRMPKNPSVKFAHPGDAPYLSVCTSSTHDMSTIRGWWEEDRWKTQIFFKEELGNNGPAPYFAEPWICRQMINQHFYSPAMWVTIPIQDLLAMDGKLRWEKTQEEQINVPSNSRNHWKFRMHQSLEQLFKEKEFNMLIRKMINNSGR